MDEYRGFRDAWTAAWTVSWGNDYIPPAYGLSAGHYEKSEPMKLELIRINYDPESAAYKSTDYHKFHGRVFENEDALLAFLENTNPEEVEVTDSSTSLVSMELYKDHPDYGMTGVYERLDYTTFDRFVKSAKSWVSDRSELSGKTIDSADYRELYKWFCEQQGETPVYEDEKEGK